MFGADPVKVLTKESFAGHINRSNEDINQSSFTFVKFYAPWCGHCKALIPVWETIGKHYEQTDAGKLFHDIIFLGDIFFPHLQIFRV